MMLYWTRNDGVGGGDTVSDTIKFGKFILASSIQLFRFRFISSSAAFSVVYSAVL